MPLRGYLTRSHELLSACWKCNEVLLPLGSKRLMIPLSRARFIVFPDTDSPENSRIPNAARGEGKSRQILSTRFLPTGRFGHNPSDRQTFRQSVPERIVVPETSPGLGTVQSSS